MHPFFFTQKGCPNGQPFILGDGYGSIYEPCYYSSGFVQRSYGGAEPQSILLAYWYHTNVFPMCSNLEEVRAYTNFRKLPLCCVLANEPFPQIWLIRKETLHGPIKQRTAENIISNP